MSLDVELLESSFSRIKEQRTHFTDCFYSNLFADYPEVKPLFAHTQMEEQPKKLFKSLVLIVESLRQPDVLTHALLSLGSRHVQYGVLPEHYPMVGSTILKALAICLGEAWTSEVEQAWSDAYSVVMKLMLEGAFEASRSPELQLAS
jgi:hemoglobin-like flavoprotein